MNLIFIITYSIWFLLEILINRLLHSKETDKPNVDKGSIYLIWIIIFVSIFTAVFISNKYYVPLLKDSNIEYFGLTNVTEVEQIEEVRYFLPDRIKIVPKIESKLGVERLHSICEALQDDEHYLMLDKEDLYTDVLANSDVYQGLIEQLYKQASLELKIVIELQGVIFAEGRG